MLPDDLLFDDVALLCSTFATVCFSVSLMFTYISRHIVYLQPYHFIHTMLSRENGWDLSTITDQTSDITVEWFYVIQTSSSCFSLCFSLRSHLLNVKIARLIRSVRAYQSSSERRSYERFEIDMVRSSCDVVSFSVSKLVWVEKWNATGRFDWWFKL